MQQSDEIRDTRESEMTQSGHQAISELDNQRRIAADMKRKMGRGPILSGILLILVLLIAAANGVHSRGRAEATLATSTNLNAVLDVAMTTLQYEAHPFALVLPADTQGYTDTPIYARTNGYIKAWYTDIGAQVHKGQILAVIESPEVDQQVDQARSDLATAEANLHMAQITEERWQKLVAKNAVSKQEADQSESNLEASKSTVAAARSNLGHLEQLQGFEKVYAPFNGVITQRNIDTGSLIQAGNSNAPGAQLFHLDEVDRLRMYVPVPEVSVKDIHNGDRVEVTTDEYPNDKFFGTVVRNASAINLQTRTLNVEVDVDNPRHALLPGQYAFVHFKIPASQGSGILPSNTLLFRTHGLKVAVAKDGRIHLTPIQIGQDYGATVEVISGLQPQDQVILNPPDSIAEGEQVRIVQGAGS